MKQSQSMQWPEWKQEEKRDTHKTMSISINKSRNKQKTKYKTKNKENKKKQKKATKNQNQEGNGSERLEIEAKFFYIFFVGGVIDDRLKMMTMIIVFKYVAIWKTLY